MKTKKFEVGKTYICRSFCDYGCVWKFKVIKRTEKTVTIEEQGLAKEAKQNIKGTYRIHTHSSGGVEIIRPLGTYSMTPILSAENEVK